MRLFFSFILFGIVLIQCVKSEKDTGERSLVEPDQTINLIDSDLSQYTLTCTDSELIATDTRSNNIYIFDYNKLEIVKNFGRYGRGPGEFNGVLYSVGDNKNVYVYDSGNQRISLFSRDTYTFQSAISVGRNVSRFIVSSEYIYFSSPFSRIETPFIKMNMDGAIEFFGEKLYYDFFGRNIFHLLSYGEKVIAVSQTEPIVQFYNKNGELLDSHNLGNEVHLTETMEFVNQFYQDPENQRRTVVLFTDASIFDDYLVLNFYSRSGGRLKTNNYIVYKIEGNTLEKVAFFETNLGNDGVTGTFCIHENKLYSNGGPNGIDIYRFDLSILVKDQLDIN